MATSAEPNGVNEKTLRRWLHQATVVLFTSSCGASGEVRRRRIPEDDSAVSDTCPAVCDNRVLLVGIGTDDRTVSA